MTVDPESLLLAEIVSADRVTADSVYAKLKAGADFEGLAKEYSTSETTERGGYMGKVNLSVFPLAIRDRLLQLQEEEFTPPVPLSGNYVIYKRVRRGPVVG